MRCFFFSVKKDWYFFLNLPWKHIWKHALEAFQKFLPYMDMAQNHLNKLAIPFQQKTHVKSCENCSRHPWFWRRRFLKVFTIYGHGAGNSYANSQNWTQIKFVQDFRPVLVLCNFDEDPIRNEVSIRQTFSPVHVYVYGSLKGKASRKTCLYNFDPLKPHFYIVNLGFTGVYIIFVISAQKHRLWVLIRTASMRRF